jgi:hypothetical protein
MQTVSTIGLDIAKSVFQVHGVDANGLVVIRRQLKRRYVLAFFEKLPSCLVGIEACASSHYWSRELQALGSTSSQGCSPCAASFSSSRTSSIEKPSSLARRIKPAVAGALPNRCGNCRTFVAALEEGRSSRSVRWAALESGGLKSLQRSDEGRCIQRQG